MGLLARRTLDAVAFATALAHSDTRKSQTLCRGYATGSVTLSSGTKAVTGVGVPANAILRFSLITAGGTLGVAYSPSGVGTTGGFTVTSLQTTGAAQTSDTSTLTWEATWPYFHADQTTCTEPSNPQLPAATYLLVTAATAADLPTTIALANQCLSILGVHAADATSHLIADATLPAALAALVVAVDQGTVNTLLNGLKAAFNAHFTQSGVHVYNDGTNTISAASATNLATSETLANAIATAITAHFASAPTGESVAIVNP